MHQHGEGVAWCGWTSESGWDGTIANGLSVDESTSFGGAHHAGLVSAAERKQQRVGETLIILW